MSPQTRAISFEEACKSRYDDMRNVRRQYDYLPLLIIINFALLSETIALRRRRKKT